MPGALFSLTFIHSKGLTMKREIERKETPNRVYRSLHLAVRVVKLCAHLDQLGGVSRIWMPQVLRAGTSIVSNIEEAQAGQGRADFMANMGIAPREARETHVRLRILSEAAVFPNSRLGSVAGEADEIKRILGSIVLSSRRRVDMAT